MTEWGEAYYKKCVICGKTDRAPYAQGICLGCIHAAKRNGTYIPFRRNKKIRTRAGVEEHLCTQCKNWKIADEFYRSKSVQSRSAGCRACNRKHQNDKYHANLAENRAKSRNSYQQKFGKEVTKELDKIERSRRKRDSLNILIGIVPVEVVRPWVEELMRRSSTVTSNGLPSMEVVCVWTGVNVRRIHDYLNKKPPYKTAYDLAEKIAIEVGKLQELEDALGEIGDPNWARSGARYCVRCGTWERPHYGRDLCKRCYGSYWKAKKTNQPLHPLAPIDREMQVYWKRKHRK